MSLSLRARFWRFLLRKIFKEQQLTIEQNRASGARIAGYQRIPKEVAVAKIDLAGLPAAWIRPAGADTDRVILHLHGGGYVTGSIDSHLMMCVPMAQTLRMNMLLPEYRLAPEQPFPAALEDALKAYRWLLAQGTSPANITISGDSAGGGLSVATVLALRDAGEPLPAAVVCISPWADLTHKGASHSTKAVSETVLKTDVLKEWALCYTDEANLSNPLVSPVYADFHGFPPLLIQVGSEEILLDDAITLAEKAKAAGVDVTFKVWAGLWHVWHALGNLIPENRQAFEEIGTFLHSKLKHDKNRPV
jgi:epsilon-lactone hydrolase